MLSSQAGASTRGKMGHFSHADAAERYARGRPRFHVLVVRTVAAFLELREPVPAALDMACGTGLSSVVLREIASRVVATDSSAEMLARAPRVGGVGYVEAPAEDLPLADGTFDLLTVSSAFHWFDRARFLSEARRVRRSEGLVVIYDTAFRGEMRETTAFRRWFRDHYLARYPSPPRDQRPFEDDQARRHGFRFLRREDYENEVRFTVVELIAYLETQSNVIAAVEEGSEGIEEIHGWLMDSLDPLFPDSRATFVFGGHIWYLRPLIR